MTGFSAISKPTAADEGTGELVQLRRPGQRRLQPGGQVHYETGGIATVFARRGNDFVRITTRPRTPGQRNMAILLVPACAGPARAGEPYTGRIVVGGKPYMGYYLPSKRRGGKVIMRCCSSATTSCSRACWRNRLRPSSSKTAASSD